MTGLSTAIGGVFARYTCLEQLSRLGDLTSDTTAKKAELSARNMWIGQQVLDSVRHWNHKHSRNGQWAMGSATHCKSSALDVHACNLGTEMNHL